MIIVHHLNYSRSTRILWLLEEIGSSYEIINHTREPGFRAPPNLKLVHPLGKSPVVEDDGIILAESAVILTYLNAKYGHGEFAPPDSTVERLAHDQWLHFAESSLALPVMMNLYVELTGGMSDLLEQIITRELRNSFDYLATALSASPYVTGTRFSIADIQLSYLLELALRAGVLADHATIIMYVRRLQARPAYQAAVTKGGPMTP